MPWSAFVSRSLHGRGVALNLTIRHIDLTFEMQDGKMTQIHANHEYPSWDLNLLREIEERYVSELRNGGMAVGAFDGEYFRFGSSCFIRRSFSSRWQATSSSTRSSFSLPRMHSVSYQRIKHWECRCCLGRRSQRLLIILFTIYPA